VQAPIARIEFWYDFASTYSYPAAMRIGTLARQAEVRVHFRPFLLGPIFQAQGWTTSPFNLFPAKGRHMWRDLERLCADLALPFRRPEPFPQSSLLPARVALVNLLTATRLGRKGFDVHIVLYGPGVLLASGTRGYPAVGQEAFPGHLAINNQIKTLLKEGAHIYACRFAMGALYGFRESDLLEGVTPFNPLDVLDSALTAWRAGAFQLNTWTV